MTEFNLKCKSPKHLSAQLLFVCLSQKCSNKRKCCVLCVDDEHQGHEIMSISKFIRQINSNIQKHNQHPEKQELYNMMNSARFRIKQEFQLFKTRLTNSINKIQSKIYAQLDLIREVLSYSNEQTVTKHVLKTFQSTDLVINDYIKESEKAKSIEIGSMKEIKKIIEISSQKLVIQMYDCSGEAIRAIQKLGKFADQINFAGKKYETDFCFSLINKALSIQIADSKNTVQGQMKTNNYTVCAFEKSLDPINDKFFVKINRDSHKTIWFGICILDVVKKNNFIGCNGLGKGTYAINQSSSITYSYNNPNNHATFSNHHEASYNPSGYNMTTTAGWKFTEGDILMVQVHYEDQEIGFYRMNQNFSFEIEQENQISLDSFRMPIESRAGVFYPFVGFNGQGNDSVSILSGSEVENLIKQYGNLWAQFNSFEMSNLSDSDQESLD